MRFIAVIPRVAALLGTLSLSRSYADVPVIRKMLSGITMMIALTIVSGIMISALIVGGLYAAYLVQVYYGMQPVAAFVITGVLAVIITMIFVSATIMHSRNLAEMPKHLFKTESPLTYRASGIANAFLDGLLTREVQAGR